METLHALKDTLTLALLYSGRCGGTCSLTGASGTKCVAAKCYATTCKSGYKLDNGVCTSIDYTSDGAWTCS